MFVDYAGAVIDVIGPKTGEVRAAQLFVAALGASSYTYVEATWSQKLPDCIASHTRALTFFGGAPSQIVSDNLKAGVTKACFYDPAINRTYADLAAHYDTAVVPARPRKPKEFAMDSRHWSEAHGGRKSRSRRPAGRALDRGPAPEPAVLQPR